MRRYSQGPTSEREQPPVAQLARRFRYVALAAMAVVGVALSLVASAAAWRWEQRKIENEFKQDAMNTCGAVQMRLNLDVLLLNSLRSFYVGSQEVTRREFGQFVGPLLSQMPGIQAMEWIPRVPDARRAEYEAAARRDGLEGFQITERLGQGTMVRAPRRDEYFPVYFVEPYRGNEPAVGFDLASEPVRRAALSRARDTGEMAVAARITLPQEKEGQAGVLLVLPVYSKDAPVETVAQRRERLAGFVVAVLRLGDVVDQALSFLNTGRTTVYLFDKSAPQGERVLCHHERGPGGGSASAVERAEPLSLGGLRYTRDLQVGDRSWTVACRGDSLLAFRKIWQAWAVLGVGLVITGLLVSFSLSVVNGADRHARLAGQLSMANRTLQEEVERRAQIEAELRKNMDALERFNRLATGRELRMIELKREINDLASELGREPPYDLTTLEPGEGEANDANDT